jgi:hypothetical protein
MTQNPMYPPQPPGMPGGAGYGYPPQPQQANGFAIAGLIFSIVGFCVPVLSGLVGLILGIVGLSKSRNPNVGGKGLSVAAIVIGILTIVGWLVFSGAVGLGTLAAYRGSAALRATARTFVQDVSAGNIVAARANASSSVTDTDLTDLSDQLKKLGTFTDMTSFAINVQDMNGQKTAHLAGKATFSQGVSVYEIELVNNGSAWQISKATFH